MRHSVNKRVVMAADNERAALRKETLNSLLVVVAHACI